MNAATPFLIICCLFFGFFGAVGLHEAGDKTEQGIASFLMFMCIWALALLLR